MGNYLDAIVDFEEKFSKKGYYGYFAINGNHLGDFTYTCTEFLKSFPGREMERLRQPFELVVIIEWERDLLPKSIIHLDARIKEDRLVFDSASFLTSIGGYDKGTALVIPDIDLESLPDRRQSMELLTYANVDREDKHRGTVDPDVQRAAMPDLDRYLMLAGEFRQALVEKGFSGSFVVEEAFGNGDLADGIMQYALQSPDGAKQALEGGFEFTFLQKLPGGAGSELYLLLKARLENGRIDARQVHVSLTDGRSDVMKFFALGNLNTDSIPKIGHMLKMLEMAPVNSKGLLPETGMKKSVNRGAGETRRNKIKKGGGRSWKRR